jgi:hypothetical protein
MSRVTVRKRKPYGFNRPIAYEVVHGGHIWAIIQQRTTDSNYFSYGIGVKKGWNTSNLGGVSFELCKADAVRRVKLAIEPEDNQ